ncbi:MAG: putative sulfate exporter family transporter, partial [Planctomycetota bacterium]
MSTVRSQPRRAVGARELALAAAALAAFALPLPGFVALLAGAACAWAFGAPSFSARAGGWLLKASVVALGAGIELVRVWDVGRAGLAAAAITLGVALAAGYALGRLLRIERDVALLITAGTAICGGSAIAAAAPALRARPHAVGIALGVVFVLNAVAL